MPPACGRRASSRRMPSLSRAVTTTRSARGASISSSVVRCSIPWAPPRSSSRSRRDPRPDGPPKGCVAGHPIERRHAAARRRARTQCHLGREGSSCRAPHRRASGRDHRSGTRVEFRLLRSGTARRRHARIRCRRSARSASARVGRSRSRRARRASGRRRGQRGGRGTHRSLAGRRMGAVTGLACDQGGRQRLCADADPGTRGDRRRRSTARRPGPRVGAGSRTGAQRVPRVIPALTERVAIDDRLDQPAVTFTSRGTTSVSTHVS